MGLSFINAANDLVSDEMALWLKFPNQPHQSDIIDRQ